jgi:hypothetical protein
MKIIQEAAYLLPEVRIVGIDPAPVELFQVPPYAAQYVYPAARRPVDDADLLFYVGQGYGRIIPQFLTVPHNIGAAVVGVFVKQNDHSVKTDKGPQVIHGLLVLDFPLRVEGKKRIFGYMNTQHRGFIFPHSGNFFNME